MGENVVSIKDVHAEKLIEKAAEKMKAMSEFAPPAWAEFVKTGAHAMRPPQQADWWWVRTASVLRKLSVEGGLGVSRLRKIYGGRKNRGHKPERKYKGSGAILRKVLQQLEKAGFAKKDKKKGRVITPQGESFLSAIAKELKGEK